MANRRQWNRSILERSVQIELYDNRAMLCNESTLSVLLFRTTGVVLVLNYVLFVRIAAKSLGTVDGEQHASLCVSGDQVRLPYEHHYDFVHVRGFLRDDFPHEAMACAVREH